MGEQGRIVLRYSGTEPLARIMVEGESQELIQEICDKMVEVVTSNLS